jgi:nucleobase:cation symporter-1, NCS1 family
VLAVATSPWKLVNTAALFLTFLSSNVVFLSPLVSIMITDYFFVRRGNVHVPSLYVANSTSPYWYWRGFNPRAFGAWLIALVSVIHGLAGSFNSDYNTVSKHIYSIGMLMSFSIAGPLYYLANLIWKVDIYPFGHDHVPNIREYLGNTDGFFEDDVIIGQEDGETTPTEVMHMSKV